MIRSKNKLNNIECMLYHQNFKSKKEGRRYLYLRSEQLLGNISDLKTQVKYVIIPTQRDSAGKLLEKECSYVADFVYKDKQGNTVVEDTKGYRQGATYELFVVKRKLMLEKYGIKVTEV